MSKELLADLPPSQNATGDTKVQGAALNSASTDTAVNPRKKIWIDIDNSPHVLFFIPIIEELKERGYEVMLIARDLYQVCELLDFFHLECQVIDGSYVKNRLMKVLGNCYRACQLVPIAVKGKPLL